MAALPIHRKQLQNGLPTRGEDCGVECAGTAIDFASRGKVRVRTEVIRDLMGVPRGATNLGDQERAIQHDRIATRFKQAGLVRPQMVTMFGRVFEDEVMERAANGVDVWFNFQIAYATIITKRPPLAGDKFFSGFHSVAAPLSSVQKTGAVRFIKVWDPLNDGRAPGIPRGPIMWPVWLLEAACEGMRIRVRTNPDVFSTVERFYGEGRFVGGMVRRARRIPVVEPEPSGDDVTEAECAERIRIATTDQEQDLRLEFKLQVKDMVDGIVSGIEAAQLEYDEAVRAVLAQAQQEVNGNA